MILSEAGPYYLRNRFKKSSFFIFGLLNFRTSYLDFIANITTVVAGNKIQFKDMLTGTPDIYHWISRVRGEAPIISNTKNFVLIFTNAGLYDVTLTTIKLGYGASTVIKASYITVNEAEVENDNIVLVSMINPEW